MKNYSENRFAGANGGSFEKDPLWTRIVMALTLLGIGLYIILICFGFIPVSPEKFKAPRYIVAVVGLFFFLIGLYISIGVIFSEEKSHNPLLLWIKSLLLFLAFFSLPALALWVGFGPGPRSFNTEVSLGVASVSGIEDEIVGRLIFGAVGLFFGFLIPRLFYTEWKKLPWLTSKEKLGKS